MAKEQQREMVDFYVSRCKKMLEESTGLTPESRKEIGTLLSIASRVMSNCAPSVLRDASFMLEIGNLMRKVKNEQ